MVEPLVVGVPRESKIDEHRVAITPDGVREVEQHGVSVVLETGAGVDSGFSDDTYRSAGAEIAASTVARGDVATACVPMPAEGGMLTIQSSESFVPAEGEGARDTRRLGIQLLDLQRRPDLVADGKQQCNRKAMAS